MGDAAWRAGPRGRAAFGGGGGAEGGLPVVVVVGWGGGGHVMSPSLILPEN